MLAMNALDDIPGLKMLAVQAEQDVKPEPDTHKDHTPQSTIQSRADNVSGYVLKVQRLQLAKPLKLQQGHAPA